MPTNDIGQDRFQERLTKELKIKGAMPAPVLAPEIVPVLIVEGERPENLHIQREHRFAASLTLGGVALEYYYFQLLNPAGRDGLVVVEEFGVSCVSNNTFVDFGFADPAVTASLGLRGSYCLDTRVPGWLPRGGMAGALAGTDVNAGLIDVFGRIQTLASTMNVVRPNIVLTAGHGFSIWCGLLVEPIAGYIIWRERQATDGELG